jgi:hypothetical protein
MSAEHSAIMAMATRAHKRGLNTPERVSEALAQIIRAHEAYLAKPSRRGEGAERFNAEMRQRNEALSAAIVLIESRIDDSRWLRRYTEHVIAHLLPRISEAALAKMAASIPPMMEGEDA